MAIQINGDGTITGINVGGLPNGIVDTDMLANNAVTDAKSSITTGKIVQVVHVDKSDYFSTTSTSHTDITGMTASITPTSASNYILVEFRLVCSGGDNNYSTLRIQRQIAGGSYGNPSVITSGSNSSDAGHSGADTEVSYGQYKTYNRVCRIKDQPNTTSQVNYKIQVRSQSSGFVLNRTGHSSAGNTSSSQGEGTSSITLMEVAA